jgi:DHA1 family tetracycline resistance protein-like MFS transporter
MGAMLTLLSVIFMNLVGFGIMVPLLPFYAQSFSAPAWQIALLFSAYSLGAFFGEPFWGRMSDRIGRKPILISSVVGTCICYGALAFAPNIYFAFFIRVIGGLMSGNGSVIQAYISDVTPPAYRSGRMGILGAAYNVGFIVGPAIGGLLAHPEAGTLGFQIPLLTSSALCLGSAIGVILFVKESRVRGVQSEHEPSRWTMMGEAIRNPVISRLILVTFVSGFAFTGIEANFGLWAQARFEWGPREIGVVFGLTGIIAAICQATLTGPLSRTFGEAPVLAAGMGLAVFASFLQIFSTGFAMTVVLMCLSALASSVSFPNATALMSRVIHPDHQGQIFGLNNAAGAIARVIGPLCASIAFAGISINAPFVLAALIVLPAVWLSLQAGERVEANAHPLADQDNRPGMGGH